MRINVYYKDADIHEYYSSVMAMYYEHSAELFGIKYASLNNALRAFRVYENKRIIVRVGIIKTSPQKRNKITQTN